LVDNTLNEVESTWKRHVTEFISKKALNQEKKQQSTKALSFNVIHPSKASDLERIIYNKNSNSIAFKSIIKLFEDSCILDLEATTNSFVSKFQFLSIFAIEALNNLWDPNEGYISENEFLPALNLDNFPVQISHKSKNVKIPIIRRPEYYTRFIKLRDQKFTLYREKVQNHVAALKYYCSSEDAIDSEWCLDWENKLKYLKLEFS
jgi:hypothetical protein